LRRGEYLGKARRYLHVPNRLLDAAEQYQATKRRHFAQLPEAIQGATFSGSLGMRRASIAASRSPRLIENLTSLVRRGSSYQYLLEARTKKGWL
jgi:hypothetical protein